MDIMSTEAVSPALGLIGALIGGATSLATTWMTTRAEKRAARIEADTRHRRDLYARFMEQLADMYAHALCSESINYEQLAKGYALRGQIALVASNPVLVSADQAMKFIIDMTIEKRASDTHTRKLMDSDNADVIHGFSLACRNELQSIR